MFEIGMAVLAAVLGTLIGIGFHRLAKPGPARIVWAVVDLLWVLGLIYAVGDRMGDLDRRFDRADSIAQMQALAGERENFRLKAFFAERKACPYMIGASAPTQTMPLCNALSETVFEATRPNFSTVDAQRLEKLVTAADSTNQVRDLRQALGAYATRSSKITPAVSATPYDEGIEQHQRYRSFLWLILILFGLRVARSAADIQRAWATRRQP